MVFSSHLLDDLFGTDTSGAHDRAREEEKQAEIAAKAPASQPRQVFSAPEIQPPGYVNEAERLGLPDYMAGNAGQPLSQMGTAFQKAASKAASPIGEADNRAWYEKMLSSSAAPGAIGALSGLGGYLAASKNRDAADAAMQKATDLSSQMNYLQNPEIAKVQDEANAKMNLNKAMGILSDRASMGLTPQDQADLEKIRNQQAQTFQSQQGQIQENMARRGMQDSGLGLAQMMGASQQAQQQAANNATDLSSQMFQAKQNAAQNLANVASGALQGQFNRDVTRAGSTDQMSQFNTNLQNQRVGNMQQAQQNMANYQQKQGQAKAQSIGNIGQGFGSAVAGWQTKNPVVGLNQQQKKPGQA